MDEIWKDVVGYEGLYEVSNFGRIRRQGRILKPVIVNGYHRVYLCSNNFKKNGLVHRLVLHALKPNPDQKPCCNHLDKNRTNNHIDNLEWCSYSENEIHSRSNGKVVWNKGKKMNAEYRELCRKRAVGKPFTEQAKKRMSISLKRRWAIRIAELRNQKEKIQ